MKHSISFSNYQQNPRRINIKSTTSLYATRGYAVEKALTPALTSSDPADGPGSTNKHRCKGRDVKKTTRFVGTNTTGF